MLSLKASRLHHIVSKPKVFPCKDLFSHALKYCKLEKRQLVSLVGMIAVITRSVFCDLYKMPRLDIVYTVESVVALLKEKDLVKEVLRYWVKDTTNIKHRSSIDYPISYFRKGVRISMAMLNRLWGKADTYHID